MKLRHLRIERFRGIRELSWSLGSDFICLIGAGDSTKTTILDAVELVLSPRVSPPFFDTDFLDGDSTTPITIEATIGELPEYLIQDRKFGLCLRGWHPETGIQDEPDDEYEAVLTIRLHVDSALDPRWAVVSQRDPDGRYIGARDRQRLGAVYVGPYLDRHLAWGHGSVLSKTTSDPLSLGGLLAQASRAARNALDPADVSELQEAATQAAEAAKDFGIGGERNYCPRFDAKSVSISAGGLSLHDGDVPLRRAGLGTRRLLTLALQHRSVPSGGLTLVDEIEYGLEPHRIRRLLRVLQNGPSEQPRATGQLPSRLRSQVLVTTHSPTVVEELPSSYLRVVRRGEDRVRILEVPDTLQPVLRRVPGAFLGNRVLVCEGKTEVGVMRSMDAAWFPGGGSLAERGVVLANGGGQEAPATARALCELGYDTAYFGDSDQPLDPDQEEMTRAGITVATWDDDMAIEERLMTDLPWEAVMGLVDIAVEEWGHESIRASVSAHLSVNPTDMDDQPERWNDRFDDTVLRAALAESAKSMKPTGSTRRGWFKRTDLGERVGHVVSKHLATIPDSSLAKTIDIVKRWVSIGT